MSKRFTDSRKWYDPWFRELSKTHKLFWFYITDTCDHAGFWKADFGLASFCLGEDIKPEEVLRVFNTNEKTRIKVIRKDFWWLTTFVKFQYNNLNSGNNLHKSVIEKLKASRLGQGLVKGSRTPKDKDKDKDKVKEKDKYLDNVYLFKQEYDKLVEKFSVKGTNDWIERVNVYVGSKGKSYKSHYFTILNWAKKDEGLSVGSKKYSGRPDE